MPASPSLLIVPARFKTGKLYTQIATTSAGLVLGSSGDFNVTRATTATRFNSAGLIESVASGVPRLDYYTSGGTAGCPALLVEPSGSNLTFPSEGFPSGTWVAVVSSDVSGVSSPDGMNTANTFTASTGADRVRRLVTLTSGTTYSFSLFGKFGALSSGFTMQVFEENATTYGSGVCQAFNLNEGTLGASGSVGAGFTLQSVGMENYGDGWYRCRMTVLMSYTPPSLARIGFRIGTQLSGGRPLSVVSGSVSVWGAQLETGSIATSYIPTTTAAVTRNADVVNLSGAVSGCIGQTEGTIYVEVDMQRLILGSVFVLDVGGTGEYIAITKLATGAFRVSIKKTSTSAVNIITTTTNAVGIYKLALGYKSGDYALYINGVSRGTSTNSTDYPTGSLIQTVVSNTNYGALNDCLRTPVVLYTTRLTNAELAALTT